MSSNQIFPDSKRAWALYNGLYQGLYSYSHYVLLNFVDMGSVSVLETILGTITNYKSEPHVHCYC